MKVVLTSRSFFKMHGYGGMERYAYFLAKHLLESGVEVEVVTSHPTLTDKDIDFNGKLTFLGPVVNKGKYTRAIRYKMFLRNVANYLRRRSDFDIVHSFGICPSKYLELRDRKPIMIQPFGSEEFADRQNEHLIRKIYIDRLIRNPKRFAMENADAIASEGDLQTQEIVKLFKVPREKIFTLPDGIDMDFVEECICHSELTREEIGVQDADLVLANVNRLAPNKGVNYLIDGLRILNNKINAKLILVGSGPQEQRIREQIKRLGLESKVIHFKNIPDEKMFQLYMLADISVTPTLYEGLPLVILEAMACGKPIVASNVSEVPQVVKDEVNGFLVPPRDPQGIANAVLRIYEENLAASMGKISKDMVKDYDWNLIAKRAIKTYERLIEQRKWGE